MFKDRETIGKYISILYRSSSSYLSKELSRYNIGSGQYIYLIYLSKNDGVTQEEMSQQLCIDKGTTAKAIKKLESEEYIHRVVDKYDKRAYKVFLTSKGQNVLSELFSVLDKWNNILTIDFSEDEKEVALKLLQRMVINKLKGC